VVVWGATTFWQGLRARQATYLTCERVARLAGKGHLLLIERGKRRQEDCIGEEEAGGLHWGRGGNRIALGKREAVSEKTGGVEGLQGGLVRARGRTRTKVI